MYNFLHPTKCFDIFIFSKHFLFFLWLVLFQCTQYFYECSYLQLSKFEIKHGMVLCNVMVQFLQFSFQLLSLIFFSFHWQGSVVGIKISFLGFDLKQSQQVVLVYLCFKVWWSLPCCRQTCQWPCDWHPQCPSIGSSRYSPTYCDHASHDQWNPTAKECVHAKYTLQKCLVNGKYNVTYSEKISHL